MYTVLQMLVADLTAATEILVVAVKKATVCVIHCSTVSQVHLDCIQTSSLFF